MLRGESQFTTAAVNMSSRYQDNQSLDPSRSESDLSINIRKATSIG